MCRRTPGHAQLPSQGLWQQIAASLPSLDCKTSKMSDSGHLRMVKQCQTKHVLQLQGRCRDSSGFSYAGWFATSKGPSILAALLAAGTFPGASHLHGQSSSSHTGRRNVELVCREAKAVSCKPVRPERLAHTGRQRHRLLVADFCRGFATSRFEGPRVCFKSKDRRHPLCRAIFTTV